MSKVKQSSRVEVKTKLAPYINLPVPAASEQPADFLTRFGLFSLNGMQSTFVRECILVRIRNHKKMA